MSATALDSLEIPELDDLDPELRGPAFDAKMAELAAETWIARAKLGLVVLDRESGEFFLRSKQATFPGKALAELFDMKEGALGEEVARNILHIDGDDHRRLRNLVNPAFTPRAADKWRPVMRDYIAGLFDAVATAGRVRRGHGAVQAIPGDDDRDRGRRAARPTPSGWPPGRAGSSCSSTARPWPSIATRSSARARSSTRISTS